MVTRHLRTLGLLYVTEREYILTNMSHHIEGLCRPGWLQELKLCISTRMDITALVVACDPKMVDEIVSTQSVPVIVSEKIPRRHCNICERNVCKFEIAAEWIYENFYQRVVIPHC